MANESDANGTKRTAVIAIHGVADQAQGETIKKLAELLVGQSPNNATYEHHGSTEIILQVQPLSPFSTKANSVPDSRKKRLRQSICSDFLRDDWSSAASAESLSRPAKPAEKLSLGARFTDFLLFKAQQNNAKTETYSMPFTHLKRVESKKLDSVDLYEMYWADLSRLSGSVPTILTELFTLLFRLSSLGRDTVQLAATTDRSNRAWQPLSWLQTALDWMYSRALAIMFLQLVMIALVLIPMSLLSPFIEQAHPHWVLFAAGGCVVTILCWLVTRYKQRPIVFSLFCFVAGLLIAWLAWLAPLWFLIGLSWLFVLSIGYNWAMHIFEERFRLVKLVGWVQWVATVSILFVVSYCLRSGSGLTMWISAALNALEFWLCLIMVWWFLAGLMMLLWFAVGVIVGCAAKTEKKRARDSVATGRIGFVMSLAFFLVLSMSGWTLLNTALKSSLDNVGAAHSDARQYTPLIFTEPIEVEECDKERMNCKTVTTKDASAFVENRFVNTTEAFSVIAVLLMGFVAFLLVVLVPSIWAELFPPSGVPPNNNEEKRLGDWLTGGLAKLSPAITIITILAVLMGVVIATLMVMSRFSPSYTILDCFSQLVQTFSQQLLSPLIVTAGAATVALTSAGAMLKRVVPALRAPLDIVLDVDNFFREFPRKAIPRVRIFSRLFAVMDYVQLQGYDKIVIVSHSQGTIIMAELLRYLNERAVQKKPKDTVPEVWNAFSKNLHLVTAGSPLKQLYAERFPVLYQWVLNGNAAKNGPCIGCLGVKQWHNFYGSGDYVGRELWDKSTDNGSIYCDECIGAEAHTHYFDLRQDKVANGIDKLIG